ncbi:MAG: 1,2-dihydroxy-3-keto-5-methylthiopentene dioxygenase [Cyanobium sp.]
MTLLLVHTDTPSDTPADTPEGGASAPLLQTTDPERIAAELERRGLRFQRWPARVTLPAGADQAAILAAYAEEIGRVQAEGSYPTVDAIRLTADHPDRLALREKFLAEHTHGEDEVRFFVEGRGLFCLHLEGEVLQVLCESGDWISVPAGTRHWFDMGPEPSFCALRFFDNPEGWVARFTGDPIAERYPRLDALFTAA